MSRNFESISINGISQKMVQEMLSNHPRIAQILEQSNEYKDFENQLSRWAYSILESGEGGVDYYKERKRGKKAYDKLRWQDMAAIRVLDYIDHTGNEVEDLNMGGETFINEPFNTLYLGLSRGTGGGNPDFFRDMAQLFSQLEASYEYSLPTLEKVEEWMDRHPSGLDEQVVRHREMNRDRILGIILDKMDNGEITDRKFYFKEAGLSREDRLSIARQWWHDRLFHLRFAFRDPELINEMLGYSLSYETMQVLRDAKKAGIPFFVNPYYLSLLCTTNIGGYIASDQAIRDYILYSRELINQFGHINAWEKEDIVKPGEPNAAGWHLPEGGNIHRRYPEVAIMIPDSMGRACGGLCTSCQRMYDFQSGKLNFNLEQLKPTESWPQKLERLLKYFEEDTQLRDILITGGDALMSADKSLKRILDAVYEMAKRKKENNKRLPVGEKKAEILRVRLGTRLPVYLPQRITDHLVTLLRDFKERASREAGIRQFVIQTHFETAMEITPEAAHGMNKLRQAGWTITNQQVFTAAASRKGHTAKLRKVLNDLGVLPYYTFTVKGYLENKHNFANNARSIQERAEEKVLGEIDAKEHKTIRSFPQEAEKMKENINRLRETYGLPFLATDRNVLNMPGVGKSNTFRTIGITNDGRRVLLFDHDHTRRHSPIIDQMGRVTIVESKSIDEYIRQMTDMGENPEEYSGVFGYSIGETEEIMPIYEYPDYPFEITSAMSNLEV